MRKMGWGGRGKVLCAHEQTLGFGDDFSGKFHVADVFLDFIVSYNLFICVVIYVLTRRPRDSVGLWVDPYTKRSTHWPTV